MNSLLVTYLAITGVSPDSLGTFGAHRQPAGVSTWQLRPAGRQGWWDRLFGRSAKHGPAEANALTDTAQVALSPLKQQDDATAGTPLAA